MTTRPNDPALSSGIRTIDEEFVIHSGLTKREYFAAAILSGLLANPECRVSPIAKAVSAADKLIRELNRPVAEGE